MKKLVVLLFCIVSVVGYSSTEKKKKSNNMCYNFYGKNYGKHNKKIANAEVDVKKEETQGENYELELKKFTGSDGIQNLDLEKMDNKLKADEKKEIQKGKLK